MIRLENEMFDKSTYRQLLAGIIAALILTATSNAVPNGASTVGIIRTATNDIAVFQFNNMSGIAEMEGLAQVPFVTQTSEFFGIKNASSYAFMQSIHTSIAELPPKENPLQWKSLIGTESDMNLESLINASTARSIISRFDVDPDLYNLSGTLPLYVKNQQIGDLSIGAYFFDQSQVRILPNLPQMSNMADYNFLHIGDDFPLDNSYYHDLLINRQYIRKSNRSHNKTAQEIEHSINLGNEFPPIGQFQLINALPKTSSETKIMGIKPELAYAYELTHNNINKLLIPNNEEDFASKDIFGLELEKGISDVLVLFAHSPEKLIYMRDGPVPFEEIKEIKRQEAPDRIVYLFCCKEGSVNENSASLAEILLENNLAKSVFASRVNLPVLKLQPILEDILANPDKARSILQQIHCIQIVSSINVYMRG